MRSLISLIGPINQFPQESGIGNNQAEYDQDIMKSDEMLLRRSSPRRKTMDPSRAHKNKKPKTRSSCSKKLSDSEQRKKEQKHRTSSRRTPIPGRGTIARGNSTEKKQRRDTSRLVQEPSKETIARRERNSKNVVNHSYHDYKDVPNDDPTFAAPEDKKGGTALAFPLVLHRMLDLAVHDGYDDIISWQPHGRCFHVHDQERFVSQVMPRFFRQTRFSSFQRQLSLYGFLRLTRKGPDTGAYYHELFLRGKAFLCNNLHRTRIKGYWVRQSSSPETEPDFYCMPHVCAEGGPTADKTNKSGAFVPPPTIPVSPAMISATFVSLERSTDMLDRADYLQQPMPPLEAYRDGSIVSDCRLKDIYSIDKLSVVTPRQGSAAPLTAGMDMNDQEALADFLGDFDLSDCEKDNKYEGEEVLAEIYEHVTQI